MPDPHAERRAEVARSLDRIAVETDDPRFRHAAGVLRGKRAGRPPADDGAALDFAAALLDAGVARSRRDASRRAALLYAKSTVDRGRMVDRLRNKLANK